MDAWRSVLPEMAVNLTPHVGAVMAAFGATQRQPNVHERLRPLSQLLSAHANGGGAPALEDAGSSTEAQFSRYTMYVGAKENAVLFATLALCEYAVVTFSAPEAYGGEHLRGVAAAATHANNILTAPQYSAPHLGTALRALCAALEAPAARPTPLFVAAHPMVCEHVTTLRPFVELLCRDQPHAAGM